MEHRGKSGKESPTRGLGEKPCKEGRMDKEKMIAYIVEKLKSAEPEKIRKLLIAAANILI